MTQQCDTSELRRQVEVLHGQISIDIADRLDIRLHDYIGEHSTRYAP